MICSPKLGLFRVPSIFYESPRTPKSIMGNHVVGSIFCDFDTKLDFLGAINFIEFPTTPKLTIGNHVVGSILDDFDLKNI